MSRSLAPILAAALFALAMPAQAQRVVRIVVPFGTGAVQDTIARAIHNELGQALGASVIVENRAGAGGSIGAGAVAKAAPDGNTLVLAAASHHIVGHLYKKLDYAPLKDFVGVGYIGNSGYAIVAPANLNAGNTREFIAAIKAKPGAYNYASAGNGSATHLGMASFAAMAGLSIQHIPMKSTGDAVNEVLAGRVQAVTSSLIGVMGYKDDPRVKFIAYTGKERSRFLPDLPTAAERPAGLRVRFVDRPAGAGRIAARRGGQDPRRAAKDAGRAGRSRAARAAGCRDQADGGGRFPEAAAHRLGDRGRDRQGIGRDGGMTA